MTFRDKFLSAILLILIGVLIGMIVMFFRQGPSSLDLAEVRFTEVTRSETPAWSPEELEQIDERFVFRSVAKNVTPTVVYVETIVPTSTQNFQGETEEDEDNPIWRKFMPPRSQTVGSGVLISDDGYILTNNHVVENAVREGITVTLEDKRSFDSRIVGRDPSTDLAVLKIDGAGFPHATIGNSDQIDVGEWVIAIGSPFRLQSTVTAGIVSALGRDVQIINDMLRIESFIQTDAAINRGNSGGALVNTSGELIGINTAIATQSGSYQGYGFAVPSNLALKVASDIIEHGEVRRGMLGVKIRSVDSELVSRIGLDRIRGVYVAEVKEDGAAGTAGLEASDVILEINNQPVNESNQLQEKVAMHYPGDVLTMTVWRDGNTFDIDATLAELDRPRQEPDELSYEEQQIEPRDESFGDESESGNGSGVERHTFDIFGFSVRGLASPEDPDVIEYYVNRVEKPSQSWQRGLQEGVKILEINGVEITNREELADQINKSVNKQITLDLKVETDDGSVGYYKLTP